MKLTVTALLCLPLLVIHINPSLATKTGKFSLKNILKKPSKTKTNLDTKLKDSVKNSKEPTRFNQGMYPQQPGRPGGYPNPAGYPQQPGVPGGYPNPAGYPQQSGVPGGYPNPAGYPQQPGVPGGYPNPAGYPQQPRVPGGYPNPAGYPQQPGRPGGYPNPAGYPQQPGVPGGYPNPAGYPQQPGVPGGYPNPAGYPQQPGRPGGYPNLAGYPQQPGVPGGYPNPAGYPQQPGGYPYQGGYPNPGVHLAPGSPYSGGYGGYPGGYINHNPNNKILSPHYAGSFGYGGYAAGGGSPFSNYAKAQGFVPSDKSRGFGHRAAMAAGGGALAGMALGYGLGRFPRPHFDFHSPREEYFYNYYMYRKYGVRSTDTNDFSRDYKYIQADGTFDSFMKSCMNRADLLPVKTQKPTIKPAVTTSKTTTAASVNSTTTAATKAPIVGAGTNSTSNSTAPKNSLTDAPSTPHPKSELNPAPTASQVLRTAANDDDDEETVSIVEIGYPALITQMKLRRCVEFYIVNAERHLKKKVEPTASSGMQRLEMGLQGLLCAATSIIVMLLGALRP